MSVRLFLCGDVMTGRGIDQMLAHPCDPLLHEPYLQSALGYVELAEDANGPIPRPVGPSYLWGDALEELEQQRPQARIVNLETAVTCSARWAPKGINYRMNPANVDCLAAARIDCCVLANNHVLDWGVPGLEETLDTLHQAGMRTAGAGRTLAEAESPAQIPTEGGARILVFSFALPTSGVPSSWAARADRPGVAYLPDLSQESVARIAARVASGRRGGDLVIASVHWGSNWGYEIAPEERRFAQALIESAGVDLFHGHSSHHPKGIEVFRRRLILYGCGDLINDYEGIRGHEEFRPDLGLAYFPALDASGELIALAMAPMRMRRFRLERGARPDGQWLSGMLTREGRPLGTRTRLREDGRIALSF